MQFCTTKCPQFCEFEVARSCTLRSKKAFLEAAMSKLLKMVRLSAVKVCAKNGEA